MILVDTSILSRVFRRRRAGADERRWQSVLEELMSGDAPLGLPGIVLQEALSGVASQKQFAELRGKLVGAFAIVAASGDDHVAAARLRNLCVSKGLNVSAIDCLIAATTIAGDHELLAVDADFESIARHSSLRLFKPEP